MQLSALRPRRSTATLAIQVAATPPIMPPEPPPAPPGVRAAPGHQVERRLEPPAGDLLGDVWEQEEVAGWRGTWIRRGPGSLFDAYWEHPGGERVLTTVEIRQRGSFVTVLRRHPNGGACRYEGEFQAGWREVSGRYSCSWARDQMPWRARIVHVHEVTPQVLR
jgi:hypothetical protein